MLRMRNYKYDAVVVGSGPNGLACAITLQQAGLAVLLLEGQTTLGGGCRSLELTEPGFKHDVCAAVMPMGLGSPFFRTLPLSKFGLEWINPPSAYVHAYTPDQALVVDRDLQATANNWRGGDSYAELLNGLVPDWDSLCEILLQPPRMVRPTIALTKFGAKAMMSARGLARRYLSSPEARAVFAGVAAHATIPFENVASASLGLVLTIVAHAVGWPVPAGGAQSVTDALVAYFKSIGGEVIADRPVRSLNDLPTSRFVFLDLTPRQFVDIAGPALSERNRRLYLNYNYGPACFKLDFALSAPIPWKAKEYRNAPTVHIGGTLEEIAIGEKMIWQGQMPSRPYVLLVQPTLFDESRCPPGNHIVWAYCHLPYGSGVDATELIEGQIERFAPGFKKLIVARSTLTPQRFQSMNENHVGGDINGGSLFFSQLLLRPAPRLIPYKTPLPNVYFCSSSTPPGSGVHGMCGYWAAWFALNSRGVRTS